MPTTYAERYYWACPACGDRFLAVPNANHVMALHYGDHAECNPTKPGPVGVWKDTNPKDAVGIKKVPFSTVPAQVTAEVGLAMLEGARKYGRHNYRVAGVRASVYYDAAMRHLAAWYEGQDVDPDSGINHVVKALACLYVLRDAANNDALTDDRPPKCKDNWIRDLNDHAARVVEQFPEPLPPHTAI